MPTPTTKKTKKDDEPPHPVGGIVRSWVSDFIALVVLLVWAITQIFSITSPNFKSDPLVGAAMLTVVGGIFGYRVIKGDR